jgi:hypothetical protein
MESKDNSEAKEEGDETLKLASSSSSSSSLSELSNYNLVLLQTKRPLKGVLC